MDGRGGVPSVRLVYRARKTWGGHFAEVEISALLTARMHATPALSASFWSPADALGAAGLAQLVEQLICNLVFGILRHF